MPEIGALYRHYKTEKIYKVIGIGRHSETLEDLVIYEAQYDAPTTIWARPLGMFLEQVEKEGKRVSRFEKIS